MPPRKAAPPAKRTLYCFHCFKWVEGRHLSGGYYCPHCSSYLQIKNQPRPWKDDTRDVAATPEK